MVANTRSAQATTGVAVGVGVSVGLAEGLVDGRGEGAAAGPQADATTINKRIAASRPRCILDITQDSRLSLFQVRLRASLLCATTSALDEGKAPWGKGAWGKEGKATGADARCTVSAY